MTSLGQTLSALKRASAAAAASTSAAQGHLTDAGAFSPNPGALRMLTYAPADLKPGAPLVVVLHGCGQTAEAYAAGSGWITLADRFGFALLCPEQTRRNNPSLCFNWFDPTDVARAGGEAASVAVMVGQLVAAHDLDAKRVFVTGLSAGGAMTAALLATYPEVFAGGAVIAGLPYGSASTVAEAFAAMTQGRGSASPASAGDAVRAASGHGGPWPPISIWHGQSDSVVRPGAGEALAAQWANVQGAEGPPVTARTPSGRDFLVWLSADGEPVVELHRIVGMGHGAPLDTAGPDGSGTAGPYLLDVGVSSSLEIALGWGIASSARPRSTAQAKARPRAAAVASVSPTSPTGVTAVIEQALRTAGLMK